MRFFAHDGTRVHGPSTVAELLALPGFGGDTLVCPVGSSDSEDWKPALSYPPFREALLAPPPKPCPRCERANPEDARYCNACAARLDQPPEADSRSIQDPAPVHEPEPTAPARSRSLRVAAAIAAASALAGLSWLRLRSAPDPSPPPPETVEISSATIPAAPSEAPTLSTAPPAAPDIAPVAAPVPLLRAPARVRASKPSVKPPAEASSTTPTARGFLLPGIPRPISKSAVDAAPSVEAEDDISRQVREQFGFCAQLLAQKAYRDYFDTCLCSQSKSAPPHRGNRDLYADRLKKSSADRPAAAETTVSIRVAGTLADISFRPETGGSTQHWKLEDGLWCRTP